MSGAFPKGSGVDQGAGQGQMQSRPIGEVMADNGAEPLNPNVPRPQPTDGSGTNTAGWVKTQSYGDGYYEGESGIWEQV